jgi:hypothetical protein
LVEYTQAHLELRWVHNKAVLNPLILTASHGLFLSKPASNRLAKTITGAIALLKPVALNFNKIAESSNMKKQLVNLL